MKHYIYALSSPDEPTLIRYSDLFFLALAIDQLHKETL